MDLGQQQVKRLKKSLIYVSIPNYRIVQAKAFVSLLEDRIRSLKSMKKMLMNKYFKRSLNRTLLLQQPNINLFLNLLLIIYRNSYLLNFVCKEKFYLQKCFGIIQIDPNTKSNKK